MHYFIGKKNELSFWFTKQKLNIKRWRSPPTLSSLAAAQPGNSVQQLIQLNCTYFILAFENLKDKYYILLIKTCIINFKIGYNFVKHFFKLILFWKINLFLRSATQRSIHRELIKKINYQYITRFKFWLSLYHPLLILTRTPFKN